MKKMNKKGFTIVELVIVIAVIAILAAVLIPTFSGVVNKANDSAALQTAQNTLKQALLMTSNATISDGSVIVLDTDKDATTRPNYVYRYGNDTLDADTTVYANDSATTFQDDVLNITETGINSIFVSSKAVSGDSLDGVTASIFKAATGSDAGDLTAVTGKTNQYTMTIGGTAAVYYTAAELTEISGQTYVTTSLNNGALYDNPTDGQNVEATTTTVKTAASGGTTWYVYTSTDMTGTNVVVFTKIG